MSVKTAQVPVSEIICDECLTTKVAVMGYSKVARATLTTRHGWKCDSKLKTDICPVCKPADLVDTALAAVVQPE
jgi:hypothetical protein